jgi:uncharacterized protein YcbK (DUF882 family)
MAARPASTPDLRRMHKELVRPRRSRLRILIASDPHRPLRTIVLPRALPTVITLGCIALVLTTVLLACGSWKMSDTLQSLEHRVRAMVQAADTVALHPVPGDGEPDPQALAVRGGAAPGLRAAPGETGKFTIQSANTGEELEVTINLGSGEVEAGSYRRLRHLMRCLRTGAETPLDPRLIELLYRISQRTHQKIVLVSGFRAPMFSLAALSYHTRGMAADIRIPGMTPLMVRDLAQSMGVRGIGYYPVSEFVHVDVRDERQYWTDYGNDRRDGEGTEHEP